MPLAVGVFANWLPLKTHGVETLKAWQTLVAGLLAIAAAGLGGLFVLYQTDANKRQEDAKQTRNHAAARAVLPLALSALVEHADKAATELEKLRATATGVRIMGPTGSIFLAPQVDPKVIRMLQDVIEDASDIVADRISNVISDVQVQDARLRSLSKTLLKSTRSIFTTYDLDGYILDSAVIYARGSALFEYARRETDDVPASFPSEEEIVTALNLLGFDDFTHPDLYKMAKARAARKRRTISP